MNVDEIDIFFRIEICPPACVLDDDGPKAFRGVFPRVISLL